MIIKKLKTKQNKNIVHKSVKKFIKCISKKISLNKI